MHTAVSLISDDVGQIRRVVSLDAWSVSTRVTYCYAGAMLRIGEVRQRHMRDITALFSEPLAARLGVDAQRIREHGLDAGAFRHNAQLHITLPDGSTMHLRYAFFVEDDETNLVGVFSEHCGYHFFVRDELRIEQIEDGQVTVSRRWPDEPV